MPLIACPATASLSRATYAKPSPIVLKKRVAVRFGDRVNGHVSGANLCTQSVLLPLFSFDNPDLTKMHFEHNCRSSHIVFDEKCLKRRIESSILYFVFYIYICITAPFFVML